MKLTKDQILEKLKQLSPLTITVFEPEVATLKHKPLALPDKVSNEEILAKLEGISDSENQNSTNYQTIEDNTDTVQEEGSELFNQTEELQEVDKSTTINPEEELPEIVEDTTINSEDNDFRQNYYLGPVKDLKFSESLTFFSPRFEKELRSLVAGKKHSEMAPDEIQKLNTELQNLSTVEFEWKEYHRRSITKEMAHEQFSAEYEDFLVKFEKIRFPKDEELEGQRAEKKFMAYKTGFVAESLIQYLYVKLEFKPLKFCSTFTPEKLGQIIVSYIDPKRIFNDLARISIKKAHEKLLGLHEESQYKDDVLSISKVELYEEFRKTLIVEIFYAILSYGEDARSIKPNVAEALSRDVQVRVFYKNLLIILESMYKQHFLQYSDLTASILEAFTSSNFFTNSILTPLQKNKTSIQLILPDHIVVEAYRPFKFPNIVRPASLAKKDIDRLIKPLINGQGSLTKSAHLVETLNISRSKPHKINKLFLALSKKFFPIRLTAPSVFQEWQKEGFIDIGTEHRETIEGLLQTSMDLKQKITSTILSLYVANRIISQLSISHNIPLQSFSTLVKYCGITRAESMRFRAAVVIEDDYVSKLIEAKYTQSRIFLAEQLQEFPLYITDILCIRLRLYPREHWLSRTAGSFKHLLHNFKAEKLTLEGFISLLEAYYTADKEQLNKFKAYISSSKLSKKTGKKVLSTYFHRNPLNFTIIRKPMYSLNLHLALLNTINNKFYTAVNVEIDQNASALVILAIVLRSKEMASVCNLVGGSEEKVSPYNYIKEKCAEFLETEKAKELNIPDYSDVCDFLRSSRSLHKYAIMCFCYNQTAQGRMEDFSEEWRKEFGFLPNNLQRRGLNLFATLYESFVEFVFPNTTKKLELFKGVVELVCAEAPHLQMKTMDGEVINWAFYATTYKNRKYYDSVERTHKSFKVSVYKQRGSNSELPQANVDFPRNLELDSLGMKRRFLSYFIHSIDASILRRIIHTMKTEYNVSINHLHDCVIIHPNHVNNFYKVIKQIYTSPELYNITFDGLFDPVSNTLSPESNEKLNKKRQEFLNLVTDFESDIKQMNPYHMYSFED